MSITLPYVRFTTEHNKRLSGDFYIQIECIEPTLYTRFRTSESVNTTEKYKSRAIHADRRSFSFTAAGRGLKPYTNDEKYV